KRNEGLVGNPRASHPGTVRLSAPGRPFMTPTWIAWTLAAVILTLGGCMSYPPALSPGKGQTAAQQDDDARECDHQVHSGARSLTMGLATAWSEKERADYVACMQGKGYTAA